MAAKKPASKNSKVAALAMKKSAADASAPRKLIAFDLETLQALQLLGRDSMKDLQELADEAFRDLLKKHVRPTS
ncbi:MAG: hypothetical protein WC829_23975, partial [Hyphomicrobium sp.]